jgi:phosphoribosylformimino-5-aminoimidazole carboxamide ribotide isomerase
MIAIPAVDIREGACVQLVEGSFADERIRIADPVEAANRWVDAGFRRLHVVDLDAATGAGSNREVVGRLLGIDGVEVQVGGGIRTEQQVSELLAAGAAQVVVGTRAIDDPEWLDSMASTYPGRIIVAADVRQREVVTHGWTRRTGVEVDALMSLLAGKPIAGVLVTSVQLEGKLGGTDLPLMRELAAASSLPVISSGGITTLQDLRALAGCGISAAVLGMALYTGILDASDAAMEFAA